MGVLGLDRQQLAQRNRRLATARHCPTRKHQLRDKLLKSIAKLPIPIQRGKNKRLLIIRPDHLGDALLATPAIKQLRRAHPDLQIHVLCGPWSAELLARFPAIDQVRPLPFPAFVRERRADNAYLLALRWSRRLREAGGYHCAIIMRPDDWWSAMLAYLAGIPRRIGYHHANVAPLLTERQALRHEHAVLQNLRLVKAWTGETDRADIRLEIPLNTADSAFIEGRLAELDINRQRLICIHPGSGAASKLWQVDKWAALADSLRSSLDCAIVFTGAASESKLVAAIRAQMTQAGHSIGATSIGQLAALYAKASLVLGPDSGALHVAAALQTPTIALFGPADPVEFAPWGDPARQVVFASDLACAPCRILDWRDDDPAFHPCVRDIKVDQVLNAALRILSGADAG